MKSGGGPGRIENDNEGIGTEARVSPAPGAVLRPRGAPSRPEEIHMSVFGKAGRRGRNRDGHRTTRPFVELCEDRTLLTPIMVTLSGDNGDNNNPTPHTLRWAIQQVDGDTTTDTDTIDFAIPTTDPGYNATTNAWTIQPASALPTITHHTLIDGYSQPGAAANTLAQGDNAHIAIDLNGASATTADGLLVTASNSTIQGLAINQFANGIHLQGGSGETVAGNFLGTDVTASVALGNGGNGVSVNNIAGNTIGGLQAQTRNVISGNGLDGGLITGTQARFNQVQGNLIGTDATGTVALGNGSSNVAGSGSGVAIVDSTHNTIGGTTAGEQNLISGNSQNGVSIVGGHKHNCWHLLADFSHHREPIHLGHLHVEEDQTRTHFADCGYRLAPVLGFVNRRNFLIRGQPHAQTFAGQRFIINNQSCKGHGLPSLLLPRFRAQDDKEAPW